MPSSYVIGDHFEQFIRQQVDSGRYSSASEVVREALLGLERQERLRQIEIEDYRFQVSKGIKSPDQAAETVFSRLEAKYQAMLDSQA